MSTTRLTAEHTHALEKRVTSGLHPSLTPQWVPSGPRNGLASWVSDPANNWASKAAQATHPGPDPSRQAIRQTITDCADHLAAHRQVLLDSLFDPDSWLNKVPSEAASPDAQWVAWCWTVEALWDAATRHDSSLLPADSAFAVPLAARLRFLVLSEPFRHHPATPPGAGASPDPSARGTAAPVDTHRAVFGPDSAAEFVGRAREARWVWRTHLDRYQDSPALAAAARPRADKSDPIEAELDQLLFAGSRPRRPLSILARQQVSGADDLAVQADAIDRHLLPRFRLGRVAHLAWPTPHDKRIALTGGLLGVAAIALAVTGYTTAGAWTAVTAYLLIITHGWWAGAHTMTPWMLRWPAAAAIGLLALSGFSPTWWRDLSPPTLTPGLPWTAAALLMASYGYLLVEATNHGVSRSLAPPRAATVLLGGLWHSALVAVLGLSILLPTFAEDGAALAALLTTTDAGARLTLLATATGWCLAAGVFTQILWDDQPITATLAHRRWRSGGTP